MQHGALDWPGFSLAERDLRWQKVRDHAAQAGFDCTLVPLCVDGRNLHLSLEQARGTRSGSCPAPSSPIPLATCSSPLIS
jgi:hypothetical protein